MQASRTDSEQGGGARPAIRLLPRLALLAALGIACTITAHTLVPDRWVEAVVRQGTKPVFYLAYGVVLGCLGLRLAQAARRAAAYRRWGMLVLAASLGTALVCAPHDFGYKVLNDEYVIAAQAKNLHFSGTSDFTEGAFPAYGQLQDLHRVVDKRPPAFSALLAMLHDFTGYRASNVFVLNAAICCLLLWLLLHAATAHTRSTSAWVERVLWVLALAASLPLLGELSTGAGLDLFNGCLLFASAYLGYRVLLEADGSRWVLPWLAVNFLLFNARYESVLYVLSCGCILLVKAWKERRLPCLPALVCMPVLLMLYVLRHRLFGMDAARHWQLEVGTDVPFSPGYFFENMGHTFEFLFIPEIQGDASFPLSVFGLVALCVLAVGALRRIRHGMTPAGWALGAYGSVVVLNLLILLGYHWGRMDELEVSRLALPLFLLLGACVVRLVALLPSGRAVLTRAALLLTVGYVFCFALPGRSMQYGLRGNYYAEVDAWARQRLEAVAGKDALVITSRPVYWNLHDIAAMNQSAVEAKLRGFEFHRKVGTIQAYMLCHAKVDPRDGKRTPLEGGRLESIYATELIGAFGYRAYHVAQLKRIVGLRPGKEAALALTPKELAALRKFPLDFWFHYLP